MKVFHGEGIESPGLTLTNAAAGTTNELALAGAPAATELAPAPARDVVLQRAVDVLKGIRVFLSWQ